MIEQLFCIVLASSLIAVFFYFLLYWRIPQRPTPPPANESDVDSTYPILGIPLHMSEQGQKRLDESLWNLSRAAEQDNKKWS
jgi:hypothetical protein